MKKLAFALVGAAALALAACGSSNQDQVNNAELNQPSADLLNDHANEAAHDAGPNADQRARSEMQQAADTTTRRATNVDAYPKRRTRNRTSAACSSRPARSRMDEAIPAATLILVRDRAGGAPELLMVERAAGMAFAAGAWSFPAAASTRRTGTLPIDLGSRPRPWRRSAKPSRRRLCRSGSPRRRMRRPHSKYRPRSSLTRPFAALLDAPGLSLDAGGADAFRPLGAQVPRGAPLRHLVLRRALPGGRLAAAGHRPANAPARPGCPSGRCPRARGARRSAADLPDPAHARAARAACSIRGNSRRRARRIRSSRSRPGSRNMMVRNSSPSHRISAFPSLRSGSTGCGAAERASESRTRPHEKGDPPKRIPL